MTPKHHLIHYIGTEVECTTFVKPMYKLHEVPVELMRCSLISKNLVTRCGKTIDTQHSGGMYRHLKHLERSMPNYGKQSQSYSC